MIARYGSEQFDAITARATALRFVRVGGKGYRLSGKSRERGGENCRVRVRKNAVDDFVDTIVVVLRKKAVIVIGKHRERVAVELTCS